MSPARSKAQFKMMFLLYKRHQITKQQLDDFTKGVNYSKLPTRVKGKKAAKRAVSPRAARKKKRR